MADLVTFRARLARAKAKGACVVTRALIARDDSKDSGEEQRQDEDDDEEEQRQDENDEQEEKDETSCAVVPEEEEDIDFDVNEQQETPENEGAAQAGRDIINCVEEEEGDDAEEGNATHAWRAVQCVVRRAHTGAALGVSLFGLHICNMGPTGVAAGMHLGDYVVRVNGKRVYSVEDVQAELAIAEHAHISCVVLRFKDRATNQQIDCLSKMIRVVLGFAELKKNFHSDSYHGPDELRGFSDLLFLKELTFAGCETVPEDKAKAFWDAHKGSKVRASRGEQKNAMTHIVRQLDIALKGFFGSPLLVQTISRQNHPALAEGRTCSCTPEQKKKQKRKNVFTWTLSENALRAIPALIRCYKGTEAAMAESRGLRKRKRDQDTPTTTPAARGTPAAAAVALLEMAKKRFLRSVSAFTLAQAMRMCWERAFV